MFENLAYFESVVERSFVPITLIVCTFIFLLVIRLNKQKYSWYKKSLQPNLRLNLNLAVAILFISFFIELSNLVEVYELQDKILSEEVRVVTGKIRDLKTENLKTRTESFKVKGVYFKYNDYVTKKYFFANRNYEDGVIKEGEVIKIYYISVGGENRIIRVAPVQDEGSQR